MAASAAKKAEIKARKRGAPSSNKRLRIYARDDFRCVYCGCDVRVGAHSSHDDAATLDHTDGNEWHLTHEWKSDALVTTCMRCNRIKGARGTAHLAAKIQRDAAHLAVRVAKQTAKPLPTIKEAREKFAAK